MQQAGEFRDGDLSRREAYKVYTLSNTLLFDLARGGHFRCLVWLYTFVTKTSGHGHGTYFGLTYSQTYLHQGQPQSSGGWGAEFWL